MAMLPEIYCPGCRTRLQIPPGAAYVRCIFCNTTASIASPLHPANPHQYPGRPNDWNYAPSYPPTPTSRKKAVVCGITYLGKWLNGDDMQLDGPANDANNMKYLLQRRYGFTESNIFFLTDDRVNHNGPYGIPTRANIINALQWLVDGCHPGDSLVFHFSGHGSQRQDDDGDEPDGMDECILPLDFDDGNGRVILDDEINKLAVNVLPHGVKLHAIIDACHSGTVLDLPYLCRMHRDGPARWEDHSPLNGTWKGTGGGKAICFSACDDNQVAAERPQGSNGIMNGAMTYAIIEAIERGEATTYGSLLRAIRRSIQTRGDGEPQLTSNEPFEIDQKYFYL